MKQFTTPSQTTILKELGFEEPKSISNIDTINKGVIIINKNYSLGELINMLPIKLEDVGINTTLAIHFDNNLANVEYIGLLGVEYSILNKELVDALYEMIIKLKKEKLI